MPENAMNIAPRSAASLGRRAMASSGPRPSSAGAAALIAMGSGRTARSACFPRARVARGSVAGRRARPRGHPDVPQAELRELGRLGGRRGAEHEIAAGAGLREGHDLADVLLAQQSGCPAIDPDRDPAVRRGPVGEGLEERPELVAHALEAVALEGERASEEVAPVDPDRAAAELPAVE